MPISSQRQVLMCHPEVEEFVHSIGICMIVGYGLTESLATVSCDHKDEPYTVGSVGRPIDNIQIKIGENEEILLKGPNHHTGLLPSRFGKC